MVHVGNVYPYVTSPTLKFCRGDNGSEGMSKGSYYAPNQWIGSWTVNGPTWAPPSSPTLTRPARGPLDPWQISWIYPPISYMGHSYEVLMYMSPVVVQGELCTSIILEVDAVPTYYSAWTAINQISLGFGEFIIRHGSSTGPFAGTAAFSGRAARWSDL